MLESFMTWLIGPKWAILIAFSPLFLAVSAAVFIAVVALREFLKTLDKKDRK